MQFKSDPKFNTPGLPVVEIPRDDFPVRAFEIVAASFGLSNSEAKRQILQGGVRINDEICKDPNALCVL